VDYIADQPEVSEVILSGGDPLTVRDNQLEALAADLAAIPHLHRIRVHSRMPIVLPERIDDHLLRWLTGTRLKSVMVIHSNHANEINDSVCQALARLRDAGVTLLNQTVILRGINDSAKILGDLSETLFQAGVLPYYLHLLDPVEGAAHFDIDVSRARELIRQLTHELPGYLVPRLVQEVPNAPAKVPVALLPT
jgi:EF-P beta-lysylation protein EpmB